MPPRAARSKASARSPARPRSSPIWRASYSPWSGNFAPANIGQAATSLRGQRSEKAHRLGRAVSRPRRASCALRGRGADLRGGFIDHTFANRIGKGTHRAIEAYERYRDRHAHVLRCDIYRYFPAIDHAILKSDFRRRIICPPTLALLDLIVDGSNTQEPVDLYFDGDDLFAPFRRRRGLPIGNLTSQFFANVYLDGFDHFVTEVLRAPYVRYVDDFALFPTIPRSGRMALADRALSCSPAVKLHPRKTMTSCIAPSQFLGFVLHADGRRRLPDDNVRRFRNRLRGLRDRWRAGTIGVSDVDARVGAWIAHAEHADTWRFRHAIFQGGRFDPAKPLKPGRPLVAVRGGSWNNNPQNLRSANRNRNTTDNRNNNLASGSGVRFPPEPARSRSRRARTKRPGPSMMSATGSVNAGRRGHGPGRRIGSDRRRPSMTGALLSPSGK